MGTTIALRAADGVSIEAYRANPPGTPRAGLVILQEIFGVNAHIRDVAERFAVEGYSVVAPALFDRVTPGLELAYDEAGIKLGNATSKACARAETLLDIQAAVALASKAGRVAVVGYCWGGTLAFAGAAELSGLAAAVGYYGGGIPNQLQAKPKVPVMLHFGDQDAHIPLEAVERVRAAFPDIPVFTYPAGHGFNCDQRGSYDKASADLALARTLTFLHDTIG